MRDLPALLKSFHDVTYLPLRLYDQDKQVVSYPADSFKPDLARLMIVPLIEDNQNANITISAQFVMSGFVRDLASGRIIVVGPVMEFNCSRAAACAIVESIGDTPHRADELLSFLGKTPRLSLSRFLKNIILLYQAINEDPPVDAFVMERLAVLSSRLPDTGRSGDAAPHNSASAEQLLLSLIESGKTDELKRLLRNVMTIDANMGVTANDSIRSFKNIFVTSAAMASRAAVRGGLDYEMAMTASDTFLQKMETLGNYNDIHALWRQMLIYFTEQAEKSHRLSKTSRLAQRVANHVSAHIRDKISAASIAGELGLNRSYLCRRFKQDTGLNLTEYIRQAKVNEARYLLSSSRDSLGEIAYLLGFSSQNYFQTVFRKITGSTPQNYRERL